MNPFGFMEDGRRRAARAPVRTVTWRPTPSGSHQGRQAGQGSQGARAAAPHQLGRSVVDEPLRKVGAHERGSQGGARGRCRELGDGIPPPRCHGVGRASARQLAHEKGMRGRCNVQVIEREADAVRRRGRMVRLGGYHVVAPLPHHPPPLLQSVDAPLGLSSAKGTARTGAPSRPAGQGRWAATPAGAPPCRGTPS